MFYFEFESFFHVSVQRCVFPSLHPPKSPSPPSTWSTHSASCPARRLPAALASLWRSFVSGIQTETQWDRLRTFSSFIPTEKLRKDALVLGEYRKDECQKPQINSRFRSELSLCRLSQLHRSSTRGLINQNSGKKTWYSMFLQTTDSFNANMLFCGLRKRCG